MFMSCYAAHYGPTWFSIFKILFCFGEEGRLWCSLYPLISGVHDRSQIEIGAPTLVIHKCQWLGAFNVQMM